MKQLSHESRALLAEVRRSEHLSQADKARIRSKLAQRIGAGLAVGTALTATAAAAEAAHGGALAGALAWLPAVSKVVGVIVITGAVGAGVAKVTRPDARTAPVPAEVVPRVNGSHRAQPAIAASVVTRAAAVAVTETGVGNVEPEASVPPLQRSKPLIPSPSKPVQREAAARTSGEVSARLDDTATDRLTDQVAAIRTARAAIREGDPRAALAILDREMPAGRATALAPEAALARVAAYCRLGQTEAARHAAEQFQRDYPQSPLTARLREPCAGASSPHP